MSKFLLKIESMPSGVPVFIRLRHVLKRLLRTYGFRCTDYQMIDEPHSGCEKTRSDTKSMRSTTDVAKCSSVAGNAAGVACGVRQKGYPPRHGSPWGRWVPAGSRRPGFERLSAVQLIIPTSFLE